MITTRIFYKRASFAPYVVTVVAVLVTMAMGGIDFDSRYAQLGSLVSFIGMVGLYAMIPYTLYLLGVLKFWPPTRVQDYRTRVVAAPSIIAVPFGVVVQIFHFSGVHGIETLSAFYFYGGAAVVIGYVYVACIQFAYHLTKLSGGITPTVSHTTFRSS